MVAPLSLPLIDAFITQLCCFSFPFFSWRYLFYLNTTENLEQWISTLTSSQFGHFFPTLKYAQWISENET